MDKSFTSPFDKQKIEATDAHIRNEDMDMVEAQGADTVLPPANYMSRLVNIYELDISLGLSRVGGDPEDYRQLLVVFSRVLPETCAKMITYIENGRIENFAIEVHGVKGALYSIGATDMAEEAETLEIYAKERREDICKDRFPDFLDELKLLGTRIDEALFVKESKEQKPKGDIEELRLKMTVARSLLQSFETDGAQEIITQMRCKDFGKQLNMCLQMASEAIESFDEESAIDIINEINQLL